MDILGATRCAQRSEAFAAMVKSKLARYAKVTVPAYTSTE
jgi:hypothetical protein